MNRLPCFRHYCTAKKLFPPVMTPMLPPGSFKNKVAIITGGGHWDWQGDDRDVCTAWRQRHYNEQETRSPRQGGPGDLFKNWQQGANFLAISATYTNHGTGYCAPSAAAKSGVETLMMSLAAEWAKYGMRFNCIAPGPVYTKGASSRLDPDGRFAEEAVKVAIQRQGEIPEVANLAAYLVSDYSSWLTGEVIRIDGGHLNYHASIFNRLSEVPKEQWKVLQAAIKNVKGS
ncbi:hypothetical protein MRX96_055089 [Rhipicephalus microplus]